MWWSCGSAARDEMPRALEQVLQPQQRADALVERVLVGDHGSRRNCRYFWCRAADLFAQWRHAMPRVVDHVVGRGEARARAAPGCAMMRAHLVLGQAAAAAHPRDLQSPRRVDHQHAVDAAAVVGRLDQQRHDVDDVRRAAAAAMRRSDSSRIIGCSRASSALLRGRVGEHVLAHLLAVHRAVGAMKSLAEDPRDPGQRGAARPRSARARWRRCRPPRRRAGRTRRPRRSCRCRCRR